MLSVQCNNLTVVRRLLESDSPPANLACQDNNCRTVLHHATLASKWGYWENTEMVKLLIEAGALLNDEGTVLFCLYISYHVVKTPKNPFLHEIGFYNTSERCSWQNSS